jgi:membrane protease YdiL (CAAX protease family)
MSENFNLIGIDDFKNDSIIGFFIGILYLLISIISPAMSIGVPKYAMSLIADFYGKFMLVGIIAPIMEELLFKGIILAGLIIIFQSLNLSKEISVAFSVILTSLIFSLYHFEAYGSAMEAAFLGAFLFSIFSSIITIKTNNVLPSIIIHSMSNIYVFITTTSAMFMFT